MNQNEYVNFTISQLIETWNQLSTCLVQNPDKLLKNQSAYWQAYTQLCQESGLGMISQQKNNEVLDKRFQHKDWQENATLNFIKRSYSLLSQYINDLIKNVTDDIDAKVANKLQFYTKQYIDAVAPSNFAHINPDILSKTIETKGINLIKGMKQFLEDLESEKGQGAIKNTDFDAFELGKNIACTPGKVIYQNDLMQLLLYTATTKKIYHCPLLIVPPWINKYYILDLQQENSLVKWLVDKGFTVFMISWVNPNQQHRKKKFSDYMLDGPLTALEKMKEVTGSDKANIVGYCIGGTLLGCMLAYLAKKNNTYINSATFLTTLFDFSEPGELSVFIDDEQLAMLDQHMEAKGYLDGKVMGAVFNALRANDLIWSTFVNNYLKGQPPKPFDLLYWNADYANIPQQVHRFYLRNMYLKNNLIRPNKIKLAGVSLDLSTIKVPSYFLAAQDDHIVPWQSAYKSSQFYGGKVTFVLTTSGHVAGVVNPPHKNKYGYWTNTKKTKKPENYLSSANFTSGSWWNNWIEWLTKYSGKLQTIDCLNNKKYNVIENAPGSYVKVQLID